MIPQRLGTRRGRPRISAVSSLPFRSCSLESWCFLSVSIWQGFRGTSESAVHGDPTSVRVASCHQQRHSTKLCPRTKSLLRHVKYSGCVDDNFSILALGAVPADLAVALLPTRFPRKWACRGAPPCHIRGTGAFVSKAQPKVFRFWLLLRDE